MPQQKLARSRPGLSAFLKARREAIHPGAVGLPAGGRRLTKGLRREEVAALAGIGVTWYTWFEQGRDIRVSTAFLDNLARALRLGPTERNYLFSLAGHYVPEREVVGSADVAPSLRRLVDGLDGRPAYVKNARWDILIWNRAASVVFGDFGQIPAAERNVAWLTFTSSRLRSTMVRWEEDARRLVSRLRADHFRLASDAVFGDLIDRLDAESADFRRLWREHTVLASGDGTRLVAVDGIGPVPFDYTVCRIGEADQLKLVIYAPNPDDAGGRAFAKGWESQPAIPLAALRADLPRKRQR